MDWLQILRDEVDKAGSIQAVATKLGYKRPSISLALSGNYKGKTDRIKAKVIATFCERVVCYHRDTDISQAECGELRSRALPQSDAGELRHWVSCQSCPANPDARPSKRAGTRPIPNQAAKRVWKCTSNSNPPIPPKDRHNEKASQN